MYTNSWIVICIVSCTKSNPSSFPDIQLVPLSPFPFMLIDNKVASGWITSYWSMDFSSLIGSHGLAWCQSMTNTLHYCNNHLLLPYLPLHHLQYSYLCQALIYPWHSPSHSHSYPPPHWGPCQKPGIAVQISTSMCLCPTHYHFSSPIPSNIIIIDIRNLLFFSWSVPGSQIWLIASQSSLGFQAPCSFNSLFL